MTPTRPELSRNATSLSPSSINLIGAPSLANSDDIVAGTQYCRIRSPIIVPGPTRTRSSLSLRLLIAHLVFGWSRPIKKAEAGPGPGGCAVARRIARPFRVEMLGGASGADPHPDFRAARIELLARQRLERRGIFAATGVDDRVIEFL